MNCAMHYEIPVDVFACILYVVHIKVNFLMPRFAGGGKDHGGNCQGEFEEKGPEESIRHELTRRRRD